MVARRVGQVLLPAGARLGLQPTQLAPQETVSKAYWSTEPHIRALDRTRVSAPVVRASGSDGNNDGLMDEFALTIEMPAAVQHVQSVQSAPKG